MRSQFRCEWAHRRRHQSRCCRAWPQVVNVLKMGLVCVNVHTEPVTVTVDVVGSGPFKVTVNVVSVCAGLEQPAHVPHVTEGIPALNAETKSQGPEWVSVGMSKRGHLTSHHEMLCIANFSNLWYPPTRGTRSVESSTRYIHVQN